MAEYLIPLTSIPQEFSISLDGTEITIFQRWNEYSGWVIDLKNTATNVSIIAGLPLVTGCDLLEPFPELGFIGALVVYTDGDPMAIPTLDNLGADSNLYYVTA